jgi:hypothetical protein
MHIAQTFECCALQDEQECSESSYQVHELRAEAAGHLCIQLPSWHNRYVIWLFKLIHSYIYTQTIACIRCCSNHDCTHTSVVTDKLLGIFDRHRMRPCADGNGVRVHHHHCIM